tara:strand:+ start:1142 stop:1798 length:657 start_codon:yes stop_codon:yes gene_type:complete
MEQIKEAQETSGVQHAQEAQELRLLTANKYAIAAFLFVLSYGLLFALASARDSLLPIFENIPILNIFLPFPSFISPMYWLVPIAGFFFMFFLVDWVNKYFKDNSGFSALLPIAFFIIALLALYISLFWYIGNYTTLVSNNDVDYRLHICVAENGAECQKVVAGINQRLIDNGVEPGEKMVQYQLVSFRDRLQNGAYYLFVLAALLGWVSRFALDKLKI